MDLSKQLVNTNLKGETTRKALYEASGQVGLNQPFRAPVYQTYSECIRGLYRQGILGFYKGNACRLAHIYLYKVHRTWLQ